MIHEMSRLSRVGLLLVSLSLVGCTNPFSPGASKAGVYKGATDTLVNNADERAAALSERFELIQSR